MLTSSALQLASVSPTVSYSSQNSQTNKWRKLKGDQCKYKCFDYSSSQLQLFCVRNQKVPRCKTTWTQAFVFYVQNDNRKSTVKLDCQNVSKGNLISLSKVFVITQVVHIGEINSNGKC